MTDIIVTGIGGQGTVSLGHLLAETLTELDIEFVAAETHGMSQRGGSVIFHLRIGDEKRSPLIETQKADCIIAGEPMEALRALEYLKPDGLVISDTHGILSPVATQMGFTYPEMNEIVEKIKSYTDNYFPIDATKMAQDLGSEKITNIILLGALLSFNIVPVSYEVIVNKIISRWPRFKELNLSAFEAGYNHFSDDIEQPLKV